jgi:hypothetical protein
MNVHIPNIKEREIFVSRNHSNSYFSLLHISFTVLRVLLQTSFHIYYYCVPETSLWMCHQTVISTVTLSLLHRYYILSPTTIIVLPTFIGFLTLSKRYCAITRLAIPNFYFSTHGFSSLMFPVQSVMYPSRRPRQV